MKKNCASSWLFTKISPAVLWRYSVQHRPTPYFGVIPFNTGLHHTLALFRSTKAYTILWRYSVQHRPTPYFGVIPFNTDLHHTLALFRSTQAYTIRWRYSVQHRPTPYFGVIPFNTDLHHTESPTDFTGVEQTITGFTYLCQEPRFVKQF